MVDCPTNVVSTQVSPWLTPLMYTLAKWIVLPVYFGEIAIAGQENIPKTGAVIVAPTHRSRWDPILVPYAIGRLVTGRHPRFMVTSTEVRGFQGWMIRHLGGFPVDIEHPAVESLQYSMKVLQEGEMLVIFPEGGIYQDRVVHPLKRGIGKIALEVLASNPSATVKVLPISIQYSQMPVSRGTKAIIEIGEPLDVVNYQNLSLRQGSKALMLDLETRLKQLFEVHDM